MTRVLIYKNRKIDAIVIDMSSGKAAAGYLTLFRYLDQEWKVYDTSLANATEKALYREAKQGDAKAAETLLTRRKNEDYESWYISAMYDPLIDPLPHGA